MEIQYYQPLLFNRPTSFQGSISNEWGVILIFEIPYQYTHVSTIQEFKKKRFSIDSE